MRLRANFNMLASLVKLFISFAILRVGGSESGDIIVHRFVAIPGSVETLCATACSSTARLLNDVRNITGCSGTCLQISNSGPGDLECFPTGMPLVPDCSAFVKMAPNSITFETSISLLSQTTSTSVLSQTTVATPTSTSEAVTSTSSDASTINTSPAQPQCTDFSTTDVNIAFGKTANQSSTFGSLSAYLAVDGNLDPAGACASTNDLSGGPNWLMVDLGTELFIGYVAITNADGLTNSNRLNNLLVGVTNTSLSVQAPVRGSYPLCGQFPSTVPGGARMIVTCGPSTPPAQFVILQQPANGVGPLIVCELEVYPRSDNANLPKIGRNLALGKPANHCSVWVGNEAALAVDGNSNFHSNDGSCVIMASGSSDVLWLVVDLEQSYAVEMVVVTQGENDYGDISITLTNTDSSFQSWTSNDDDQQSPGMPAMKNAGGKLYVACYDSSTPVKLYRYVVIAQASSSNVNFTICEVEVYASVNLALNKDAGFRVSASPTDPSSISSSFGCALDGYINLETGSNNCAQTGDSIAGPKWMMVDLGQVYSIGYVIVTNTADDCCIDQTDYFNVGVTNTSSDVHVPVVGSYPLCGIYPAKAYAGARMMVVCGLNTPPAQYIIIQQRPDRVGNLKICEIEIYERC